jgi:hypothetical protein
VTHPTAAERTAVRKRARTARRAAQLKAARLKATRARRRAARDALVIRAQPPRLAAGASGSGSSSLALPFLLVAFTAALIMLALALTPARAVPWSRVSLALEDHRDELGVIGALSLVATVVFFLLVQVTK